MLALLLRSLLTFELKLLASNVTKLSRNIFSEFSKSIDLAFVFLSAGKRVGPGETLREGNVEICKFSVAIASAPASAAPSDGGDACGRWRGWNGPAGRTRNANIGPPLWRTLSRFKILKQREKKIGVDTLFV